VQPIGVARNQGVTIVSKKCLVIGRLLGVVKGAVAAAGLWTGLMMAAPAEAAPIGDASFGIGGAFRLPAGTHLGNTNALYIDNGGQIIVHSPDTMDLAGLITLGMSGIMRDLPNLSSFTPIAGFISLASGVTVDLNSLTVYGQWGPSPGFINMAGNAVIHAPGFDATAGVLTFSGTSADNITFTLAVTASAHSQPVPLSGAEWMLFLGMIALFLTTRRNVQEAKRAKSYAAV
jgi:hypothetical protein